MRPKISPSEFAEWLKKLPQDVRRYGNEQELNRAKKDYEEFVYNFNKGICVICGKPLKTFSVSSPCLHWLLHPKKFKKKHFPNLFKHYGYFRMSAYVRWVASTEIPLRNINDLTMEHSPNKLFEYTVKYKHITWSFSCSMNDYKGHSSSSSGNFPHYHMQMKLDGKRFITYSDFHIPFNEDDLYDLELILRHHDIVKHTFGPGIGIQDIMDYKDGADFLIELSEPTDNFDDATLHLQTFIMAQDGETIPGELLQEAIKESKESKKTLAAILPRKLKDRNISITTIVSPGDGIPEAQKRTGRKKRK